MPSFVFLGHEELAIDETRVEADRVVRESEDLLRLSGDVNLFRREQQIEADDVLIDRSTDIITATGNIYFVDPNYRIEGPSARVDNRNNTAEFEEPSFEISQRHARGEASLVEKLDPFRSRYEDIQYTSCDPGDNAWYLRASELEIDRESGRGEATHTTIYVEEVPIIYLPYFQFPIDDRRMSGVLTPNIGYSSDNGFSLLVPVYWNMAPNYDMTITPGWFSERGPQLTTENRYLFESNQGQVDLSYIDDKEFDDTRWFQRWQHAIALPEKIRGDLLLAETSDGDFFDDFSTVAPEYNDTRHLERYVRFRRTDANWNGQLIWQDFQTLDENTSINNRPYNSLPRFNFNLDPEPWKGDLSTPARLEWAEFERDQSVDGRRSHAVGSLRWDSEDSWYFFRPDVQVALTDYELDDNPAGSDSINRALPTYAIDSGLIFERLFGDLGQWRQTLEPRLYFLYTPFEDQDDIPDFDTSLASSTYSNLFRNNRFNGADRIGDAEQVTFGLVSRVFDDANGDELLNARIGQIYYFDDRRVSLNGVTETEDQSDVIGELDYRLARTLDLGARLVFDPEVDEFVDRDFSVGYYRDRFAVNFGYYFTEDELEQALASLVYPINERWEMVAKIHRSLKFDEPVENLLGFSYESCCWGIKILAGQTGDEKEDFADTETSIYFEFTFKGLSQAGQDIDTQLGRAIPGYRPAF